MKINALYGSFVLQNGQIFVLKLSLKLLEVILLCLLWRNKTYLFVRNLSCYEDNTILSYRIAMKWTSFCVKVDF